MKVEAAHAPDAPDATDAPREARNADAPDVADALPAPAVSPASMDDLLAALQTILVARDQTDAKAERSHLAAHHAAELEAMQRALDDLTREGRANDKGLGFFASIGKLVNDLGHDAVTLHAHDLVTDAGDDCAAAVNSKQFWQDVADFAGKLGEAAAVAGSTAVAVASFGAASGLTVGVVLAFAAAAASTAGMIESETHVLQKLGVDAKTDGWLTLGLSVGGAALSAGAGFANTAAAAADIARTASRMGAVASAASGSAHVVEGAADVALAVFRKRADDAHAASVWAEMQRSVADRALQDLAASIDRAKRHERDDVETLRTTTAIAMETDITAASAWRAA
jgi:hypothetical protein